jgi:glycosyltransferase involved in cell wall biosynthesis
MIKGKKVVVVFPAYNAAKTLEVTYNEIDREVVDEVIIVDDCSSDNTFDVARELGINTLSVMRKILVMGEIRKPVTIQPWN